MGPERGTNVLADDGIVGSGQDLPEGPGPGGDGQAFRAELRQWLGQSLTADVIEAGKSGAEGALDLEVLRVWNRRLADAGWAAPARPARHGGRDAGIDERWP